MMVAFPLLLTIATSLQGRSARDSLRTLTADEIAIYSTAIRDVVSAITPKYADGPVKIALDPILRRSIGPPPTPWSGIHLSIPSLDALLRASGIQRTCEPAEHDACRGSVRGIVLRLPVICTHPRDSVHVILVLTTARSEHDNTAMAPELQYYVYDLTRQRGGWIVQHARRALSIGTPDVARPCS